MELKGLDLSNGKSVIAVSLPMVTVLLLEKGNVVSLSQIFQQQPLDSALIAIIITQEPLELIHTKSVESIYIQMLILL